MKNPGFEIIIQNNEIGPVKEYSFHCKATTKNGIFKAIRNRRKEIIRAIELYFGEAAIIVVQDGEIIYKGRIECNIFAGRGVTELW